MAHGKPSYGNLVSVAAPLLDGMLEKLAGRRMGFALIVFDFGQEDGTDVDYVSNAPRKQMIGAIRGWLNQQKGAS